jgi:hypothetical protein
MKMALSLGTIFATVAKKLKTSRKANSTKFPVNNKGNVTKKLATKAITPKICLT